MGIFSDLKEDLSQTMAKSAKADIGQNNAIQEENLSPIPVKLEKADAIQDKKKNLMPVTANVMLDEDLTHVTVETENTDSIQDTVKQDEDLTCVTMDPEKIVSMQEHVKQNENLTHVTVETENADSMQDNVKQDEDLACVTMDPSKVVSMQEHVKQDENLTHVIAETENTDSMQDNIKQDEDLATSKKNIPLVMPYPSNADIMQNTTNFKSTENTIKGADIMNTNINNADLDKASVITAEMNITGNLSTEGSVDVIGTVNGNIDALGKLNITGQINGNSKAAEIYTKNANIYGDITSEGFIEIGMKSVVIGNVTSCSAIIAGAVKGDIDVQDSVVLAETAVVLGNIKSKSVQINNGAVIEGMCSQCYANINPNTFFKI